MTARDGRASFGRAPLQRWAERTATLVLAGALAVVSVAWAAEIVVEDWRRHPSGASGIPAGWEKYETPGGRPVYDFVIVEDGGRRALRLRTRNEHSTIAKPLTINLENTPILEWSWKVAELPAGADLRRKDRSDAAAEIFLAWERKGLELFSPVLAYVWDSTAPAGTTGKIQRVGNLRYVVVRGGTAQLNTWLTERRNVREDYRKLFGKYPESNPRAISLSVDSNDTAGTGEALVGSLVFRSQ